MNTRSLRRAALAAGLVLSLAGVAHAQTVIPDDPYGADPVGVVDDPCPVHVPLQTDSERRLAKLHQVTRDFGQLCRYRQTNLDLVNHHERVTVVFIGDSITDHWLEADPSFFSDGLIDRGISGQTTAQMLVRFRQDVIALRPRAVHIMAGTNDVAGNTGAVTLETVEGNIESMAELASANDIAVVIASVPPADHFPWRPETRPAGDIGALNQWLKAYAARRGFAYVDYYAAMATDQGAMAAGLARDGVHPTVQGYGLMRALVAPILARTLAAGRPSPSRR